MQKVSTTSNDILESRKSTLNRLQSDLGFSEALENASRIQRNAERSWLQDPGLSEFFLSCKDMEADIGNQLEVGNVSQTICHAQKMSVLTSSSGGGGGIGYTGKRTLEDLLLSARQGTLEKTAREKQITVKNAHSIDSASLDDIQHEAVITIFGTNSLRFMIPNFPLTFAYVETNTTPMISPSLSSSPISPISPRRRRGGTTVIQSSGTSSKKGGGGKKGKLTQTTSLSTSASLLVEDVFAQAPGSKTLSDAIRNGDIHSAHTFCCILVQVAYALKFAYEKITFTHYDLHSGNVILNPIREANSSSSSSFVWIPYEGGNIYVLSKYVARFVEFGFSHATISNSEKRSVSFGFSARGRAELVEIGIFRDRPNPMTDIYRLLLTCAIDAKKKNNIQEEDEIYNTIGDLIKYFNQSDETLDDVIRDQADNYYYLPLTTHSRIYNFEDFISHVKQVTRVNKLGPFITTKTIRKGVVFKMGMDYNSSFLQKGVNLIPEGQENLPHETHVIPSTFGAFHDFYNALLGASDFLGQSFSEDEFANLSARAKNLTVSFTKGFTEEKSAFDEAINNARRDCEMEMNRVKSVLASAKPSLDVERDIGAVWEIVKAFSRITDIARALKFTAQIYWKDNEDSVPDRVLRAFEMVTAFAKRLCPLLMEMKATTITTMQGKKCINNAESLVVKKGKGKQQRKYDCGGEEEDENGNSGGGIFSNLTLVLSSIE